MLMAGGEGDQWQHHQGGKWIMTCQDFSSLKLQRLWIIYQWYRGDGQPQRQPWEVGQISNPRSGQAMYIFFQQNGVETGESFFEGAGRPIPKQPKHPTFFLFKSLGFHQGMLDFFSLIWRLRFFVKVSPVFLQQQIGNFCVWNSKYTPQETTWLLISNRSMIYQPCWRTNQRSCFAKRPWTGQPRHFFFEIAAPFFNLCSFTENRNPMELPVQSSSEGTRPLTLLMASIVIIFNILSPSSYCIFIVTFT